MRMNHRYKSAGKVLCLLMLAALFCLAAGCGQQGGAEQTAGDRDTLYQVSLLQGLTMGDFSGSVTAADLKEHGDTGIGTFDGVNGELIMLDGTVYRAAGDGSVEEVPDQETIPFANVTYFDADDSASVSGIDGFQDVCSDVAFAEFSHTPNAHRQAEDRLHRSGQKSSVTSYYLVAPGTVDMDAVEVLDDRAKMLDGVLDGKEAADVDLLSELLERRGVVIHTRDFK